MSYKRPVITYSTFWALDPTVSNACSSTSRWMSVIFKEQTSYLAPFRTAGAATASQGSYRSAGSTETSTTSSLLFTSACCPRSEHSQGWPCDRLYCFRWRLFPHEDVHSSFLAPVLPRSNKESLNTPPTDMVRTYQPAGKSFQLPAWLLVFVNNDSLHICQWPEHNLQDPCVRLSEFTEHARLIMSCAASFSKFSALSSSLYIQ